MRVNGELFKATYGILIVIAHIAIISGFAIFCHDRMDQKNFFATLATITPVFGVYVGVVVKDAVSLRDRLIMGFSWV
jgi:amino acid permease